MGPKFETVCSEYASLWKVMALRADAVRSVQTGARRILAGRSRYEKVSAATNVPWFVIGLIHMMESDLSFNDHLHNGDPLSERTVHVPRGRPKTGSPPFTWEESAIDALGFDGFSGVTDNWCVERIAFMLEGYNGWGYRNRGIASPYLWSKTNNYTKGKYIEDGVFDPNYVSEQSGAMGLLSVMRDLEAGIVLTYLNGRDASHDPETGVVSAGGDAGKKPKSTVPPDIVTVASGVGVAVVAVSHSAPTTSAPPAPSTPSAPAPSTPAPAAPAPSAPTPAPSPAAPAPAPSPAAPATTGAAPSPAVPAPHPAAKTVTTTVQPAHPVTTFVDNHYPLVLGGLIVVFLIGLYLSWRARSGRATSAQAFVSAIPQLISRAASGEDISSAPLVRSLRARVLTVAWIVATIVVNAIALAYLLQDLHIAPANWYAPFSWLGHIYHTYTQEGFTILSSAASTQFRVDLSKWPWIVPFVVLYASTASAFLVANVGLMRRDTSANALWGAIVHAGWLLAIPTFILDAIRYRVVTRFARQNTLLFFGYIAVFVLAYVGARFINDDFLAPYQKQNPGYTQTLEQGLKDVNQGISAVSNAK